MTNKQTKIIENKIAQQSKEITELQNACSSRLEVLARNDGVYQNLQGQVMEKQKRLIDMREFLQMISKEPQVDESGKPRVTKKSPRDKKPEDKGKVD